MFDDMFVKCLIKVACLAKPSIDKGFNKGLPKACW